MRSDLNECVLNNGGCEGICDNFDGGYECTCGEGKVLNVNRHSCDGSFIVFSITIVMGPYL